MTATTPHRVASSTEAVPTMLLPDHPDHPEQHPDPGHQEAGVRDLPPFTRCGVDGATEFSAQWWRWVLDGPADGRRPSTDDRPSGPTDAPDDPASWATGPHIP